MIIKQHLVSLPSFPPVSIPTHTIHAVTLTTSPTAPWLVFANSLLTDWTMWNYIIPYFLDLPSSTSTIPDSTPEKQTYNILLHSQRGHGLSTLPSPPNDHDILTTIPLLATDIANLLAALSIPTPVHSVIGVSQGGAASLAFAALYGSSKTKGIVACDTAPRTPAGNKEAWAERIRLASGSIPEGTIVDEEYAMHIGMKKLANVTVPRWFPVGSFCAADSVSGDKRRKWMEDMVERTRLNGFIQGAIALSDYNVLSMLPSAPDQASFSEAKPLLISSVKNVLLLAGTLDGGGKVANVLRDLQSTWSAAAPETTSIQFVEIEGAGHLPMIDSPEIFCQHLGKWLLEC